MIALAAGVPSASAAGPAVGGSPAYGGTAGASPLITGLQCLSGCAASSASRGSRPLSVRDQGVVKVRGRNMLGVRTVIFTGAAGTRDDVRATPRGIGRLSVDVVVPARAASGRVVLYAPRTYSPPSPAALIVLHHGDGNGDSHHGGDSGGGGGGDSTSGEKPSAAGLIWPVPSHTVLSPFGEFRGDHYHSGVDIGAAIGTPVRAAAAGHVLFVGLEGGYGNLICVAHNTISTCYAHLSEFDTEVGKSVGQGEVIGKSGCTGNCTGPHLHFEVRTGTAMWASAVNPLTYLPGAAVTARSSAVRPALDFDLPVSGP